MTAAYLLIGAFYSMIVGASDPSYPWSWWWIAICIVVDVLLLVFDKQVPSSNNGYILEQGGE